MYWMKLLLAVSALAMLTGCIADASQDIEKKLNKNKPIVPEFSIMF